MCLSRSAAHKHSSCANNARATLTLFMPQPIYSAAAAAHRETIKYCLHFSINE